MTSATQRTLLQENLPLVEHLLPAARVSSTAEALRAGLEPTVAGREEITPWLVDQQCRS